MNTVERIAELERQNEVLREALREARKHIVDWWRPDDSLPPAKSWQFVERLDALLENSPAAADAGALPPIGYLDRFNVFFPQRIPGFELRPIYDRSTAADAGGQGIKEMVNRFLGWELPETFAPDCFISFDSERAEQHESWPIGTNLLSADQAKAMFEYCLRSTTNSAAHQEGGA